MLSRPPLGGNVSIPSRANKSWTWDLSDWNQVTGTLSLIAAYHGLSNIINDHFLARRSRTRSQRTSLQRGCLLSPFEGELARWKHQASQRVQAPIAKADNSMIEVRGWILRNLKLVDRSGVESWVTLGYCRYWGLSYEEFHLGSLFGLNRN